MAVEKIFSRNATFQKFEVLKTNRNKRYHYFEFLVEGVRNLNEAVRNGWKIRSFLFARDKALSGWALGLLRDVATDMNYELTGELMESLSGKTDTSELLAVISMREDLPDFTYRAAPLIMLYDRPSNRGNLGTVIRSADALGADGLIVFGHAVDLYDPEVVVSSMGSFFKVPVIRMASSQSVIDFIERMRQIYPGFQALGTSSHAEIAVDSVDLTAPLLLMLGNETDGLCRAFCDCADQMATIPMAGDTLASSLNAACAATVLLYEAKRQRRGTGER